MWIGGPDRRRQEALDAQREYFRANALHTDREWIGQAVSYLAGHARHPGPGRQPVRAALGVAVWRRRSCVVGVLAERDETGLLRDLTDPTLSTRFLGDLYQDLSEAARTTYALLQTPEFVEEFILDRTLEPAMAERSRWTDSR